MMEQLKISVSFCFSGEITGGLFSVEVWAHREGIETLEKKHVWTCASAGLHELSVEEKLWYFSAAMETDSIEILQIPNSYSLFLDKFIEN